MAIESVSEVEIKFRFRIPPGLAPEVVAQQIAQNGLSVAIGLVSYLKSVDANVVPAVAEEKKLHIPH